MKIHDQQKSFLCWVFALASSLKSSLKIFIDSLPITKIQRIRCQEKLNDKDLHKTMRLEICMIIPTLIDQADEKQALNILPVLKRMCTPTTLSQPGIFLLASISEIIELAGVKEGIEKGDFYPKLIDICPGELIMRFRKQNEIVKIERSNGVPYDMNMRAALEKKLCPLITVSGLDGGLSTSGVSTHAMVAFALTSDNQESY